MVELAQWGIEPIIGEMTNDIMPNWSARFHNLWAALDFPHKKTTTTTETFVPDPKLDQVWTSALNYLVVNEAEFLAPTVTRAGPDLSTLFMIKYDWFGLCGVGSRMHT